MRLIDADALLVVPNINWVAEYDESGCYTSYMAVPVQAIIDAPTVGVACVIYCKECDYHGRHPWGHPGDGWCRLHGEPRNPNYFCASAKKRESVEVKADG